MNGCMPYTGEIYLLGRVVKSRYNWVRKNKKTPSEVNYGRRYERKQKGHDCK